MKALSDKQIKVLKSANHRWNIFYGATRSGKTHVSYFTAMLHIQEHYKHNILFAGKTLNTVDRNVFDPMRNIFGKENVSDIIDKKEIIIFGKRCYVVGANDDRAITKIQGVGLGYAYCDELTTFPENFFQMLKSRLDAPGACCDATCNPESPSHFVKQFLDKPGVDVYGEHFTIYDNPFLSADFVKALEDEYRGTIYFDKWILGKWVKAEGLVFPLFKRETMYITPEEYKERIGAHYVQAVILGTDGATTNDSTAVTPLVIMDDGRGFVPEIFYHNPKINGQLSNEQLVPLIMQFLTDLETKYHFKQYGAQYYMPVDCAAADLCLQLKYNLASYYNVNPFTHKDILMTTDTVNNAFARGVLYIWNMKGYYNYYRKQFITGDSQLVVDLETMTWDKNNEKYDPKVPNDCADAFRYAVCTYFSNPDNLWITPDENQRFKEIGDGNSAYRI